jgi:hypothetical protein
MDGSGLMALSNYTELRAAIANWLNREDDPAASIPEFVELAESRLNKELRISEMEKTAYADLDDGSVGLPVDYLESRRIISTASGSYQTALQFLDPTQAGNLYPTNLSGPPIYYTISGNKLSTFPSGGDGQVTMIYYAKLPTLLAYGTNWLLTKAPDCYLYGSLMEAAPFLGDDQRVETWATLLQKSIESLMAADIRSRYATSVVRVPGNLP